MPILGLPTGIAINCVALFLILVTSLFVFCLLLLLLLFIIYLTETIKQNIALYEYTHTQKYNMGQ